MYIKWVVAYGKELKRVTLNLRKRSNKCEREGDPNYETERVAPKLRAHKSTRRRAGKMRKDMEQLQKNAVPFIDSQGASDRQLKKND